jgi:RND family efflux transporter MFP subunit
MTSIKNMLLSVIAIILVSACSSDDSEVNQELVNSARPAKLETVGQGSAVPYLSFPAVIQSKELSVLSFEVSGMIDELLVVEAQLVKKGDVLAKLDQRDLLAKLQSATSQYELAQTDYQRAFRLIKEDAISRSELEERKSKQDVNKSQFETAKKALEDTVLLAPFDGAIAKVAIEKRQIVQAGNPAITILGKDGLEAKFNLPSNILANVKKQAEPQQGIYLTLAAVPEKRILAVFKEVSLEADAVSQTHEVIVTFKAPEDLTVLPGVNALVWFKDPRGLNDDNKITVPMTAIVIEQEQKFVWVVDEKSMVVKRREIVIADGVGANLEVISGLTSGEVIVVAGVSNLSEGMKVRPWSK